MMDPNQVSTSAITPVKQFERIQSILFPVDPAMSWYDCAAELIKRINYGSAEWIWHLLTYLKLQPMYKHKAAE